MPCQVSGRHPTPPQGRPRTPSSATRTGSRPVSRQHLTRHATRHPGRRAPPRVRRRAGRRGRRTSRRSPRSGWSSSSSSCSRTRPSASMAGCWPTARSVRSSCWSSWVVGPRPGCVALAGHAAGWDRAQPVDLVAPVVVVVACLACSAVAVRHPLRVDVVVQARPVEVGQDCWDGSVGAHHRPAPRAVALKVAAPDCSVVLPAGAPAALGQVPLRVRAPVRVARGRVPRLDGEASGRSGVALVVRPTRREAPPDRVAVRPPRRPVARQPGAAPPPVVARTGGVRAPRGASSNATTTRRPVHPRRRRSPQPRRERHPLTAALHPPSRLPYLGHRPRGRPRPARLRPLAHRPWPSR
jgi:hypothetical protein